jgi:hypothetical protein
VDNIKIDLREIGLDGMDWLVWPRIGTTGGLLWTRYWTFGIHKMLGSSRVAAQLVAPQERLGFISIVAGSRYSDGLRDGQPGFVSRQGKILLYSFQVGSGAQPASYPMDTGGSFPGCKAVGAWSRSLTSI